jgi:hypothetical protein
MSGTYTITETYCAESLKLGHETVHCALKPHEGDHHNPVFGTWPPCPNCGGLDMHSNKCPTPDVVGPSSAWAEVTWSTGKKPLVRCGSYLRRRW